MYCWLQMVHVRPTTALLGLDGSSSVLVCAPCVGFMLVVEVFGENNLLFCPLSVWMATHKDTR